MRWQVPGLGTEPAPSPDAAGAGGDLPASPRRVGTARAHPAFCEAGPRAPCHADRESGQAGGLRRPGGHSRCTPRRSRTGCTDRVTSPGGQVLARDIRPRAGPRDSMAGTRWRAAAARWTEEGRTWRGPLDPPRPGPMSCTIRTGSPRRDACCLEVHDHAAFDRLSGLAARLLGTGHAKVTPVHRPGHRRRRARAAARGRSTALR